ncbi:hypothetical protein F3J28_19355 [Enterobacter sp. Ap-1006]|nr:hypothetical protein [Enterobacter sp. Ap-1006]
MMNIIKRLLKRFLKSLFSPYIPTAATFLFAVVLVYFFPDGPIWPVGVFFILMVYITVRYLKW